MKSEDWENANLVQTAVKLAKMKRIRKKQTTIQMSLLVPVLGIIAVAQLEYLGFSALAGLLVGGAIGLRILAKMQHTNDDVIQQIEELTKE